MRPVRPTFVVFAIAALSAAGGVGCVGAMDDPSNVHDLRVLSMSFEPPDLMAPDCSGLAGAIATFSQPIQLKALIADPAGGGRTLTYDVAVCADHTHPTCTEMPGERVQIDQGTLTAGEWTKTFNLGSTLLPDGSPLLYKVFNDDPYKGLGGLWMPLVLHLRAGDQKGAEEIYAQKIMVFSCKAFADSAPNQTPELPGVTLEGQAWTADAPPTVHGTADVMLSVPDYSALQEAYVIPSFYLTEVHLTESWRISWYTNLGTISPTTTGGTDIGGTMSKPNVTWSPPATTTAQDATFYTVVRDGRGGESWLTRTVHFYP